MAWYLADLVEEITVQDDARNVVHINLTLIRAGSPGEAFEKAVANGKSREDEYWNPDGKRVTVTFRGLRDLFGPVDDLEDGTELAYEERMAVAGEDIDKLVKPKDALAVFSANGRSSGPNYADREIVREAEQQFGVRFPGSRSDELHRP